MSRFGLTVVVGLALSACASNVDVRYPAPTNATQSGSVVIRFSEPIRAVSVSIDGILVVEDRHTERVHVADVPAGMRDVSIVADASGRASAVERRQALDVAAGREVSMLVPVPPRSLGSWIWSAASLIGYAAILVTDDWWRH